MAEGDRRGGAVLVVNPYATRSTPEARSAAVRAVEPLGLEQVIVSREPGAVVEEVRAAAAGGARLVVALGGDGTVAEVASALAGTGVVAVPLPGGGTNVFARSVGWPSGLAEALAALPRAAARHNALDLRLGRVRAGRHDRVVVINVGMGVDAETVHWVEAHPGLKRRLRQGAFVLGAWRTGALYAREAPRLEVRVDGGQPFAAGTVLAACGSPYTFLGHRPIDLVPGAAFDDRLAWRALISPSIRQTSMVAIRAASGRGDAPSPALVGGRFSSALEVRSRPAVAVQCDGEPLGWHAEATVSPGPLLRTLFPDDRPSWSPPPGTAAARSSEPVV